MSTHTTTSLPFDAATVEFDPLLRRLNLASTRRHWRELLQAVLTGYLHPHVLVVDEVGYLSYGPDAANVLFHVVNERHLRGRSMLFTTNKSPLTAWGAVLHDADLAEAIVDRILERGRLMLLDGPCYRTQHLDLDVDGAELAHDQPVRMSGKHRPEFSGTHSEYVAGGKRWVVDMDLEKFLAGLAFDSLDRRKRHGHVARCHR